MRKKSHFIESASAQYCEKKGAINTFLCSLIGPRCIMVNLKVKAAINLRLSIGLKTSRGALIIIQFKHD